MRAGSVAAVADRGRYAIVFRRRGRSHDDRGRRPRLQGARRWSIWAALGCWLAALPAASAEPFLSRGWTFDEQGGASLFAHVCAACHQADGRGAVGAASYPALAGDSALASTDYVLTVVLGGLHTMPALGAGMSDAQVADVVNYARERFGAGKDDPATAARVAAARVALKR